MASRPASGRLPAMKEHSPTPPLGHSGVASSRKRPVNARCWQPERRSRRTVTNRHR